MRPYRNSYNHLFILGVLGVLAVGLSCMTHAARAQELDAETIVGLFELVIDADPDTARKCLATLTEKIQTGEITAAQLEEIRPRLQGSLDRVLQAGADHPLYVDSALLAATWGHEAATAAVRRILGDAAAPSPRRVQALDALIAAQDPGVVDAAASILRDPLTNPPGFRAAVVDALGRVDSPRAASIVLESFDKLEPALQPKAVELLTQRPAWRIALIEAVEAKRIASGAVDANQIRKLTAAAAGDDKLAARIRAIWGAVREGRNPQREQVIAETRRLILTTPGDPHKGQAVFQRVCAQCHIIYGQGQSIGPDLTGNGRGSFEQLLSNVLDPNLVIGEGYQLTTVLTTDDRAVAGLPAEQNEQRMVIRMIGGQSEVIPRDRIRQVIVSPVSFMPEALEATMTQQELIDLFSFLSLDRPPSDPQARALPGSRPVKAREAEGPEQFDEVLHDLAPDFAVGASGQDGVGLLAEHHGRPGVIRTHPVERGKPAVIYRTFAVPADQRTLLQLSVSHHPQGDWQLRVMVDGKPIHESIVGPETTLNHWADLTVDLTPFAGRTIRLELHNHPTDWFYEFGYWGRIAVVSQ